MKKCLVHTEVFDDSCATCRQEYLEMKSSETEPQNEDAKKYKELTEERAKKLYEELMLQYLRTGQNEMEADKKAKAVITSAKSRFGLGSNYLIACGSFIIMRIRCSFILIDCLCISLQ